MSELGLRHILKAVFLLSQLASPSLGFGLDLSGKHILILYPVVDAVQGSYLFMVSNPEPAAKKAKVKLMLPKETVDWAPQEGIGAGELALGDDGGLFLEKEFAPGESLFSLGFKVPAYGQEATITVEPSYDISTFSVFVPEGPLEMMVKPIAFSETKGQKFGEKLYNTYNISGLKGGEEQAFVLRGVYAGRTNFYIIGWVSFVLLVVVCGLFAYRTMPRERVQ